MQWVKRIGSSRVTGTFFLLLAGLSVYSFSGNPLPPEKVVREHLSSPPFLIFSIALWISLMCRAWSGLFRERPRRPATCLITSGAALFLAGLSLSLIYRTETEIIAAEGEETSLGRVVSIQSDIPGKVLVIGREKIEGVRKAGVEFMKDGKIHRARIFPFSIVEGRLVSIDEAGLSPRIIAERGKDVLELNHLQLLPPGTEAGGGDPETLSVATSLSPERTLQKGRLTAREYNLSSPSYRVVIKDGGGRISFDRVMKERERYREGDLTITLEETTRWVKVRDVSDPFFFLVCLGMTAILAGTLLYPFQFYRVCVKKGWMRIIDPDNS